MKKNYIGRALMLLLMSLGIFSACQTNSKEVAHAHAEIQYTCPMHPQVIQENPGKCPICGMDLVAKSQSHELVVDSSLNDLVKPVNAQVFSSIPLITAQSGTRIFSAKAQGVVTYDNRSRISISSRVSGRIERLLIKYNYQPVSKGQLIMELYSPDLSAAQRELLMLGRDPQAEEMLQAIKQRLLLLGMSEQQINQVLQSGEILYKVPVYSPVNGYILEQSASTPQVSAPMVAATDGGMDEMGGGASTTVAAPSSQTAPTAVLLRPGQYVNAGQTLFTIYKTEGLVAEFALPPSISRGVKIGQKLLFYAGSDKENMFNATVGLIEPVVRSGQSFAIARIYLKAEKLNPGQILTANIPIVFKNSLWLDRKAVWHTGNNSIIFKKQKDVLVPMKVETGPSVSGLVQIRSDIKDWKVASNASYLIDSESFIKGQGNEKN